MKKSSYLYIFLFLCSAIFLTSISAFALLQVPSFQQRILCKLLEEAKQQGIDIQIEQLSGLAPLKWSCRTLSITWNNGTMISLQGVRLKIALLPLLQKKLSIHYLRIHHADVLFHTKQDSLPSSFSLPAIDIATKTLQLQSLSLYNLTDKTHLDLSLLGKVKLENHLKEVLINLLISEPTTDSSFHVQVFSSQIKQIINAKLFFSMKNNCLLFHFLRLPATSSLEGSIRCLGPWQYWQDLSERASCSSLNVSFSSIIHSFSYPPYFTTQNPCKCDAKGKLFSDLSSTWQQISLANDQNDLLAKGSFSSHLLPLDGSLVASIQDTTFLSPLFSHPISGSLNIKAALSDTTAIVQANSHTLHLGSQTFTPASCTVQATKQNSSWQGSATATLQHALLDYHLSSDFTWNPSAIQIHDISMQAGHAKASGTVTYEKASQSGEGCFFFLIPDLKSFRFLFPSSSIDGKIGGNGAFSYRNKDLSLSTHMHGKNIRYHNTLLSGATIDLEGYHILTHPQGNLHINLDHLFTKKAQIASLTFRSYDECGLQMYQLEAQGQYREPFFLSSSGFWQKQSDHFLATITSLQGDAFRRQFHTLPFTIEQHIQSFSLCDGNIQLGAGSLACNAQTSPFHAQISTHASHIPLDLLSLFYPHINVRGYSSFEGTLSYSNQTTQGHFLATLEEALLPQMQAKGSLQLHFTPKALQIHSHIYATEQQFLDWSATIPISYHTAPFHLKILPHEPWSSEITTQGEIDNIFDFLQLANQKATGWISSHLLVSGTYAHPKIFGDIELQNGLYENYFSGIRAKQINMNLLAQGSTVELKTLEAKDQEGGTWQSLGTITLDRIHHFPFQAHSIVNNFSVIQSNFLSAKTSGVLDLIGDAQSCFVKGNMNIDQANIVLSDNLPSDIPSLPVEFINKPIYLEQSHIFAPSPYPIHLNIQLCANDTVSIQGRGLHSLWQGDITVSGSPQKLIGKGELSLQKGEFVFSGKTFTLSKGELTFSDKPGQESHLAITGQLQLPSVTVIAHLQGPLTTPKLTFNSIPQLPTSSILSLILFNKDISEITPLQTLQLAQVIMSLSGTGTPDVLESIRKTIGIDKLTIGGKEGSDELSLQIGWCIAHGITVSLSQSPTSSDVTVEVDLKNGFVFQAESQNQQEGKFSLKWNKHY